VNNKKNSKLKLYIILNLADEEEDDDDEKYDLLKRVLFHKPTVASTQRSPNVIDNLVYPSSIKRKN
jgi:hypothetical protein